MDSVKKASPNRGTLFRTHRPSAQMSAMRMDRDRKSWHSWESSSTDRRSAARSMRRDVKRGQHWTVILLLALALQPQVVCAVGTFEVQLRQWVNPQGFLQNGQCCDPQASGGQRCSSGDQCDTFFKACLKEYQARVAPTGTCTYGTGTTPVLGGNSHTLHHHGNEGSDSRNGQIVIPFKYAWPKSFSLVIEALDHDNETSEAGREKLIERVLLSSMLNPGEQWQSFRHHGRTFTLEYRLRFRCDNNYYGPLCNKLCRARDDFFGHFDCDPSGTKVCKEGWTGAECRQAVCKQGCHLEHGSCDLPGDCKCHYGWRGELCDECETFPGCDHGTCTEPWKCVCDTNWGGLLCDKDLNYCGNHQPCKNGGTCTNTEPNEYLCVCQEGFRGRSCDIVEHACLSSPCENGGTCVEDPTGFSCVCAPGWTGPSCASVLQCDSNPCGRGATCQETTQGFQCVCPPFWTGRTCQLDTNECETGVCVNARSCRNLIGGYLCDCLPGWSGPNCDIRNSSCQGFCLNGGHCKDSQCVCLPGFSGKLCQAAVNACDSSPCVNGGQCVERQGGRDMFCSCPLGYTGTYCEVELDHCNPNPCPKGVPCHSTEGGYKCTCPEGYFGNDCQSLKDPCHEPHCQGAVSDPGGGGFSVYMVLVGVFALLVAGSCSVCALLLSRLHRRHRTKAQLRTSAPEDNAINNQRQFCTLIRNLDHSVALLPPAQTVPTSVPTVPMPVLCSEEIELTHPSPAPSPALKQAHGPKLDICNREREKLNRFHYAENQELEV
ncbi:protein jagged-1b-like isoform X2 [Carassius auratus]|uniref:Delta-like protein n=1 Tax=Carassius auratus TaxID=7957 RepID=A0A6P6RE15_CARAU|nr:protein jagged-1b-like isoform X2 [Carassius auratus]